MSFDHGRHYDDMAVVDRIMAANVVRRRSWTVSTTRED